METTGSLRSIDQSAGAFSVELGDLDADGRPDLVAKIGTRYSVALNTGGATWAPFTQLAGANANASFGGWTLGDVDGDGDPDLVSSWPSELRVHAYLSALTFAPPVVVAPFGVTKVLARDFDNDGDVDLVASSTTAASVI